MIPYFTVPKGIDTNNLKLLISMKNCVHRRILEDTYLTNLRITHPCWNVDRGTVANQESGIQKAGTVWNNMRSLARWDSSAFYQDSRQFFVSAVLTITSFYGSRSEDYCRSCITPIYCMCPWHIPDSLYACSGSARRPRTILFVQSGVIHPYTDDHPSSVLCRHRVRKRSQDSFFFSVWD